MGLLRAMSAQGVTLEHKYACVFCHAPAPITPCTTLDHHAPKCRGKLAVEELRNAIEGSKEYD